jgi:hypothetical protein
MKRSAIVILVGLLAAAPLLSGGCNRTEVLDYSVIYNAGEYGSVAYSSNGTITGEKRPKILQYIFKGKSTSEITAVPNTGYVFVNWAEDENTNPTRHEDKVFSNLVFTAVFEKAS